MKLYTKEQLLKKYKGKYVDIYPHYDYMTRETTYEVRSVKNTIHENHNPPEEAITL